MLKRNKEQIELDNREKLNFNPFKTEEREKYLISEFISDFKSLLQYQMSSDSVKSENTMDDAALVDTYVDWRVKSGTDIKKIKRVYEIDANKKWQQFGLESSRIFRRTLTSGMSAIFILRTNMAYLPYLPPSLRSVSSSINLVIPVSLTSYLFYQMYNFHSLHSIPLKSYEDDEIKRLSQGLDETLENHPDVENLLIFLYPNRFESVKSYLIDQLGYTEAPL